MNAVLFFNWAACNMGWSGICGNRWWTHLIAFVFVIPLALPSKLGIFAATSMFATVVIVIASKTLVTQSTLSWAINTR